MKDTDFNQLWPNSSLSQAFLKQISPEKGFKNVYNQKDLKQE